MPQPSHHLDSLRRHLLRRCENDPPSAAGANQSLTPHFPSNLKNNSSTRSVIHPLCIRSLGFACPRRKEFERLHDPGSYENWIQSFWLSHSSWQCWKDFQALLSSGFERLKWSCALYSLSADMLSQLATDAPILGCTNSWKTSRWRSRPSCYGWSAFHINKVSRLSNIPLSSRPAQTSRGLRSRRVKHGGM
jgi:hypothetical protein